jgi:hypothetical protein
MWKFSFNFLLQTAPLRSHWTIIFSRLTDSFYHDNRSPVKLYFCKANFVTNSFPSTANKYQNDWEARNSRGKKFKHEYGTRCAPFQMPLIQLRISTCYFILHCRSHFATRWNKLRNLVNCANRTMRMFAAKCKQKKEVPWGSKVRGTNSRWHIQHVTESR